MCKNSAHGLYMRHKNNPVNSDIMLSHPVRYVRRIFPSGEAGGGGDPEAM
jgi:hypothetical protein